MAMKKLSRGLLLVGLLASPMALAQPAGTGAGGYGPGLDHFREQNQTELYEQRTGTRTQRTTEQQNADGGTTNAPDAGAVDAGASAPVDEGTGTNGQGNGATP
jgi:hypothetical protein